ncbi:MAG: TolC family protein [Candidatus Omnitrophica bacterium]|nr:TolC family protein [Candidatus Omnitrophota bacterium]MDD5671120.1 TolC family protein [Candidatus Omnitrophota bacterium]
MSPRIFLKLWVAAIVMGVASGVFAAPEVRVEEPAASVSALGLVEYCDKVLAHYPDLKKQNEHIEETIAHLYLAYMGVSPRVQGLSSVTTSDDPVEVFGMLLREEKFTQNDFALSSLNSPRHHTNFNFAMEGNLPVFNAFQTISKIRSSRHVVRSEKLKKEFLEMEAMLVAVEAYLKILFAHDVAALSRDVQKDAEQDVRQAEELKQKGMILGADFYAARVTLSAIKQQVNQTDVAERTAGVLAGILVGNTPDKLVSPQGKLSDELRPVKTFDTWLLDAFKSRRDLLALESRIKAQKVELFREKTSILPRIDAFGAVAEDTHDWRQGGENFTMGFKGTMDLWDPTYWPRIKASRHQFAQIQIEENRLKDAIARDVAEESAHYETLTRDLTVVRDTLKDAEEAVKLTATLYREGRKSIADLLEMRSAYLNTAMRYKHLLVSTEISYAKLLFLTGTLDKLELEQFGERLG